MWQRPGTTPHADFLFLPVGVTYLPIPGSVGFVLLFIIERIFLGASAGSDPQHLGSRASSTDPGEGDHGYLHSAYDYAALLSHRHADRSVFLLAIAAIAGGQVRLNSAGSVSA